MKEITIRDAVLGDIKIAGVQKEIIDDPNFQRLRYIRQTGFLYLTYPGANHTRFEHSVGTMKVTSGICEVLDIDNEELVLSGLLHDIGHAPFSHQSEDTIYKYTGKNHEQIGIEIMKESSIRDRISDSTLSYKKVVGYMKGRTPSEIISGPVGADRIDYLVRDSYYTGTAYGMIETDRIKSKMAIHNGKVGIKESGIQVAESILIARYYMFMSAYIHHNTLIAGGMFNRALELAIGAGEIDPSSVSKENDYSIMEKLMRSETRAADIAKNIMERRLLKRVYYKPAYNSNVLNTAKEAISGLGIDPEKVIVRLIKLKGSTDDINVIDKRGKVIGKLSQMSDMFTKLKDTLQNKSMLLVAADAKERRRISEALSKAL